MSQYQSQNLLNELQRDVKEIISYTKKHLQGLSFKELNAQLEEGKWSIAECLEHLNIYSRYYLEAINKQMQVHLKKGSVSQPNFKSSWLGKMSIQSIHPDNVKPQKTMKKFNPSFTGLQETVLTEFLAHQETLLKHIETAKSLNLSKVKIPIEFARFLKLQLGDCLMFVVRHEQRHLNQMQRVYALLEKAEV